MLKQKCDRRALALARAVHERERPDATILFGSRARGDYEDKRSDVDIMLVTALEPDSERKGAAAEWAEELARSLYNRRMPVELTWFSRAEFREMQRYINHVTTQAMLDGVIMTDNPEEFQSKYEGDVEESEYEYEWTGYDNRLFHAEQHILAFNQMIELGNSDLLIGQQAQAALEHGLKAVILGHGGLPGNTHEIHRLLGTLRRLDPEFRDFALSIEPAIYTDYAGQNEYARRRNQPRLTDQEKYRERTNGDVERLLARARQLGPNRESSQG